ncbi:hypothetical protein N7509_012766 [Penicillium cosmopolitanum]|uniref:Uncharacterized protein n=1 Tax=Penicillium cosmopolitanum TaxID=1131564 RepID=A0A9W9VDU9_9EURO|nr:uncharacterized protein N7509_012766 [Penicillium cosmopolitanum]KAJ5375880.1 hypothetical protein N7509_012766 [Penicillium cosmopolitanum]
MLATVAREHHPRHRRRAQWETYNPVSISDIGDHLGQQGQGGSTYNLFTAPGSQATSNPQRSAYRRLLQQSSREFFSTLTLNALTYRHLIIAITKKHLQTQTTVVDLHSAAEALDNVFAVQAGHSASVNRQIYAVESAQPLQLQPELLQLYRHTSHL